MDVMKVYLAGTRERARLVAAKEMLAAYSDDDYMIREIDKDKDTYTRSLDSRYYKDKWTTILKKKKKDIQYRACMDPWQQEQLLSGSIEDALQILKEVAEG